MKFDKIIEYQKIDSQLVGLEGEVAKSKERAALAQAKGKVDAATEIIGKLNQEAGDVLKGYDRMKEKTDALKAKLDEFDGIIDGMEDPTEADYYLRQVASIEAEIQALEKEAIGDQHRADSINQEYKKTWDQGVKATDAYKSAKADYDSMMRGLQPKVKEIGDALAALKAEIPADVMELYAARRQAKKFPIFVEYDPQKNICGGCYMELAGNTKGKLKNSGDVAVCPNCNRVLFVP